MNILRGKYIYTAYKQTNVGTRITPTNVRVIPILYLCGDDAMMIF